MTEPTTMIPLSVVDALIAELEEIMDIIEPYDHPEFLYEHKEKLREWYIKLKKLTEDKEKKEAISSTGLSLSSLACPWSIHYEHYQKFDTIKQLEEHLHTHEPRFVIRECAELIARNKTTEQRIRDRIAFLEAENKKGIVKGSGNITRIDELRKLVSPSTVEK